MNNDVDEDAGEAQRKADEDDIDRIFEPIDDSQRKQNEQFIRQLRVTLKRTVGEAVRHFRKSARLTQAALAHGIGIYPASISDIERGKNLPDIPTLFAISETLGVSLDDLTGVRLRGSQFEITTKDATVLQLTVRVLKGKQREEWAWVVHSLVSSLEHLDFERAVNLLRPNNALTHGVELAKIAEVVNEINRKLDA